MEYGLSPKIRRYFGLIKNKKSPLNSIRGLSTDVGKLVGVL